MPLPMPLAPPVTTAVEPGIWKWQSSAHTSCLNGGPFGMGRRVARGPLESGGSDFDRYPVDGRSARGHVHEIAVERDHGVELGPSHCHNVD